MKEPVLCIFEASTLKFTILDIKYQEQGTIKYPAQQMFIDEESLVFMGIDVGSKKLGMTYIYCRNSGIYHLKLSTNDLIASKLKIFLNILP